MVTTAARPCAMIKMGQICKQSILKCLCIEIFDNFLLADIKTVKSQEESPVQFVNICFRSRYMNFQSLGNFEKKCEKKVEHFVPI